MRTIAQVLDENRGLGKGFDFLRIFLAVSIVTVHAFHLTGHLDIRKTPFWFTEYAFVPMFFALSGFLITASGLRLSLKNFLINRGLRIVPALAVDICLCALIIGPLMTTVPLSDYYTDSRFWSYFMNIFGYIHYRLPGVFETHVSMSVNGALWTVPYEIFCYIIISFLIFFGFLKKPDKVVVFTVGMILLGILYEVFNLRRYVHGSLNYIITVALISRESQIVTAFLMGIIAYQYKDKIPYSGKLFCLALAICAAASFWGSERMIRSPLTHTVLLPALTYMTVFIGLSDIKMPEYFTKGDYSYGIYLYHDPILQVVISFFPVGLMSGYWGTALVYAIGLPLVFAFANFSWNYIEKPILALRKNFSFVAKVRGVEETAARKKEPDLEQPEAQKLAQEAA